MATTEGFVGTIEVETRGVARLWFDLTMRVDHADWVEIAGKHAWFTMNLESSDRPVHLAELSLIKDALRDVCGVKTSSGTVAAEPSDAPGTPASVCPDWSRSVSYDRPRRAVRHHR